MNNTVKETGRGVLDTQREHWQATFASTPEMFGSVETGQNRRLESERCAPNKSRATYYRCESTV
jgi:hypothetical protein